MRVMMTAAYDGTGYSGWQRQENAISVEEVINAKLGKLLGEEVSIIGASRTDSGVHALGNVFVFDTDTRIPAGKLSFALNTLLPDDIRITGSREVNPGFHPRKCESVKTYEYRIWNSRFPSPVMQRYSKFVYYELDLERMREGARCLIGEHDFASFCSSGSQAKTTVRTITDLRIEKKYTGDPFTDGRFGEVAEGGTVSSLDITSPGASEGHGLVAITVSGTGFLYNMVRIIAGSLINVGTGLCDPGDIERMLEERRRSAAGPKAEAAGLTLISIRYNSADLELN